ncbi:MAG: diacylglycerol kinase family protein [Prosthecochloris sp.]|uniref:diacylglycerol/lipid kinase family protein n=1 Tax=Prosthecochloris sp. TaxID=290513 RepID=UPI00258DED95|nr:diacylglycerol kinase family protein [Prosthecochloris sp.]MCW8798972.1 diacylglycerol kinase family protein [Prosthecochloris sp.]
MKYTFIVNPVAGSRRLFAPATDMLKTLCRTRSADIVETRHAGHAGELAEESLRNGDVVIACGGDGTAHEVANILAFSERIMGVFPAGSANDFVKSYEAPSPHSDPEAFFDAPSFQVDLGRVMASGGFDRLFLNSFGAGLTGRIARRVRQTRWLRGDVVYLYALLRELLGYTALKMHIKLITEGETLVLDEPVFAFSVGNGRVEGGRFHIAPDADITDCLLDVCILKSISRIRFLPYVFKYMSGSQVNDPRVVYKKVSAVELAFESTEVIHMDGEVFEDLSGTIRIDAAPRALNLLGYQGVR